MQLDPSCPTILDFLDDSECPIVTRAPSTTKQLSTTTETQQIQKSTTMLENVYTTRRNHFPSTEPEKSDKSKTNPHEQIDITTPVLPQSFLSGSTLVITLVGILIAFLFVVLLLPIIVSLIWTFRTQSIKRYAK